MITYVIKQTTFSHEMVLSLMPYNVGWQIILWTFFNNANVTSVWQYIIQTLKRTTTPRERWTVYTKRNASRTERNALGTERFAFLGTERFVRFGLVFNYPRYSDFLAWRIGLLFIFATQNENKFHLIRSTCSFVIFFFFDLKKDLSRWKLWILSIYLNKCVYIAKGVISIWASTVLKIVTLIDCLYMY